MTVKQHPAYKYAKLVLAGTVPKHCEGVRQPVGRYVRKQAAEFIRIADGKDPKYCINEKRLAKITKLLKVMRMPSGLRAGVSVYDATVGYQWLFYVSVLCVVHRADKKHRRYETAVLEICRKNFKTFTVATVFILLMLLEPRFSKLFSVAPDGALSRQVQEAIKKILQSSPLLMPPDEPEKYFRTLMDKISCKLTDTEYVPLNYSNSRLDGREPNVFLVDEAGDLPNAYAIEAMQSGQVSILNKLGCIISTKYPRANSAFEDIVSYDKKVLDGLLDDETVFALLYEPDEEIADEWATNPAVMAQSNPAALEVPEIWENLLAKRQRAIDLPSARENFLTKHCNIIYQGNAGEQFVAVDQLKACRVEKIDWAGMAVYVGVDLAMSNDNCAVAFAGLLPDNKVAVQVMGFIPEGKIEEKTALEKFDYKRAIHDGECIACGERIVDYDRIENYVFDLAEKYGVTVMQIGYDRYNAISSAQKWENGRPGRDGREACPGIETVEVRQHSDTLHMPTKLFCELVESGRLAYVANRLFEVNVENAKCTYDTNMNRYVNKKRSNGKVDCVMAVIDGLYLLQQNEILDDSGGGFVCQVC